MYEHYGKWKSVYVSDGQAVADFYGVARRSALHVSGRKEFDGDSVHESLLIHGILSVIPPRSKRARCIPCNFGRYKELNHIKRMFNRLRLCRRIATSNDKTTKFLPGFLHLDVAKIWQPDSANQI